MSLTPGTRLGVYEITAPIGEGGPPSLTAAVGRSYGGATVAMEKHRKRAMP